MAQGGTFEFVSPGGQTMIFYDPPQTRGTIPELGGEDLLEPAKQIRLADYAGVIALASGTQIGPITGRGLLLIAAYCLGLGLPFVLLALGAHWAVRVTTWARRHTRRIQQTGGVLLITIGIALATGLWGELIAWLRGPISGFTIPI